MAEPAELKRAARDMAKRKTAFKLAFKAAFRFPALPILVTALLVVAPMAWRGASCGDDLDFHLVSWMEVVRSWRGGVFYPRWVDSPNYGAGEPRLVFYPPASWMLGSLLGSAAPWAAAPVLFDLLVLLGFGWSMYRLAREWASPGASCLAACLYIANPYAAFVIYYRAALGELLAGVWMPLVIWFAVRRRPAAAWLGAALAASWLSDAPAGVMASYTVAFLALAMLLREKRAWPAWRALGGVALGLGLAAIYIVPAVREQPWVQIFHAIDPGLRIEDSFLFLRTGDSYHDHALRIASWILAAEACVGAAAAILAWKKRNRTAPVAVLASLLGAIFFMQLPQSDILWTHLPRLAYLQFPWRWLCVLSVTACALIALAADSAVDSAVGSVLDSAAPALARGHTPSGAGDPAAAGICSRPRLPAAAAIFAALTVAALAFAWPRLFFQPCDEEDAVAAQVATFQSGQGVAGSDEYVPASADNHLIQQGLPAVRLLRDPQGDMAKSGEEENPDWEAGGAAALPASIHILRWSAQHRRLRVACRSGGFAVLRLMDYPQWRVLVNGRPVEGRPHRGDGLLTVPLAAGDNLIDVRWIGGWDTVVGGSLSLAALLALLAVLCREGRRASGGQV